MKQLKASKRKYIFGMFYPEDLMRVADFASQEEIMSQNGYIWILGEGDNHLRYQTDAEKRPRLLIATYGMGWIEMDIAENKHYKAALKSFKTDEELQQYYISRKVSTKRHGKDCKAIALD